MKLINLKSVKKYLENWRLWFVKILPYGMLLVFITALSLAFLGTETFIQDLVLIIGDLLAPCIIIVAILTTLISFIKPLKP
jgi:hypothetical protein